MGSAGPASTAPESGRSEASRQAAGTFLLKRDTEITIPFPYSSSVNQPTVGGQGDAILQAGNWYAAISSDNGASFQWVSPYATFPPEPFPFSGGFCCDQRVVQDPARDLVIWVLSYVPTGTGPADTNGIRLAVAHGAADVSTNSWDVHDITPADFGFGLGTWLDYPHAEVSANFLHLTINVFTTGSFFQVGTVIGRIPLAALASNGPYTMDAFSTVLFADVAPVAGATTTMYFGSVTGSGMIDVVRWPEASAAPTRTTVSGLAFTNGGTFSCPGPDGLDPCTRGLARMQTGWLTTNELGFMWHSGQGFGRPYPFVRSVVLDPSTLAVLAQPDIWSNNRAYLYPYVAVNARGHLGGVVSALGGDGFPTVNAIIRDNFSPSLTTAGWELHELGTSTHGTAGRWGDYAGAVAHEKYPNTWLTGGHLQEGGSLDQHSRPHNYWFMREQDDPGGPSLGSPTPTRTPASPTVTRTPSPTPTATVTPSPTRVPVGGRGFTLQSSASGVLLSWQPGQGQTGYVVLRFGTSQTVLPFTGPLPGHATSFLDTTAALAGNVACYVLVPTGVTPPANSDLVCTFPNTGSPVTGPGSVGIRLDQSNTATLTWAPPLLGGQTGYLVYPLSSTTPGPMVLPGTATSVSVPITGATCYLLVVLRQTTATGHGDIVCGVPGIASL